MSNNTAYLIINTFALVILIMIYSNMSVLQEKLLFRQRLFMGMLKILGLEIILDTVIWILDGVPGTAVIHTNMAATVIYIICGPVIFFLFSLYITTQIRDKNQFAKSLVILLSIPTIVNAVIALLSIRGGYYFYYDQANVYHRGPLFLGMAASWIIYMLYCVVFLVYNHKKLERRILIPLFCAMIPPIVAGILQIAFYGLPIIWGSLAISVQIVFMGIQNGQLYSDYLTGLYNRRQFDNYLDERVKDRKKVKLMAGIMLDLDSFKDINDKYGHVTGDSALVDTAQILRTSFRKTDVICRYGGDEFVVIFDRATREEVDAAVNRLIENTNKFNEKEKRPYKISFSAGYDTYDYESGLSAQLFVKRIDARMYENKKRIRS